MSYNAFDSFEGLPEPSGIDAAAEFKAGQFLCSENDFRARLKKERCDLSRIGIYRGWFDQTLPKIPKGDAGVGTISLAYIDCDLYASTVPVMEFLTDRITQGTILLFDDWFHFRADPSRGVQLAVNEWLQRNPCIQLIPWQPFCHHGQGFFVNRIGQGGAAI
jgi:hypothetical protein